MKLRAGGEEEERRKRAYVCFCMWAGATRVDTCRFLCEELLFIRLHSRCLILTPITSRSVMGHDCPRSGLEQLRREYRWQTLTIFEIHWWNSLTLKVHSATVESCDLPQKFAGSHGSGFLQFFLQKNKFERINKTWKVKQHALVISQHELKLKHHIDDETKKQCISRTRQCYFMFILLKENFTQTWKYSHYCHADGKPQNISEASPENNIFLNSWRGWELKNVKN